jgi:AraC-like DNA-binding protein
VATHHHRGLFADESGFHNAYQDDGESNTMSIQCQSVAIAREEDMTIQSSLRLTQAAESLGAVAVELVEAARSAWDGDPDGAKACICRALTLLGTRPGSTGAVALHNAEPQSGIRPHGVIRGGLAPFQARRLVEYIDTHVAERISLHQLARMAGLSSGHFSRAFKQTFGVPAHSYLIRRRVEFAKTVMLSTQLPLSDIALNCGLSDQSHFTRVFRRIVGETPYAWRRARRDALGHVAAVGSRVASTTDLPAVRLQRRVILSDRP